MGTYHTRLTDPRQFRKDHFFYLKVVSQIIAGHFDDGQVDFGKLSIFIKFGDIILGMRRQVFQDAIVNGNLFRAQILQKDECNHIGLTSWCSDYLSGLTRVDLTHEMFVRGNDEVLEVSDFDIQEDIIMVLDTLLMSKGRQNILLYGSQGTGKTSFARSLANKYGKELFTVKASETDKHKDRLRSVYATVNLAGTDNSIVLVDEADEIINSANSYYFESRTNKSWINQFLESHGKKVVWITNRSDEIASSTMRRFSFSIEFKKLSRNNRLKVLRYELKKKGMETCFTDAELNELCREYNVDAGGIVNAISTVNTAGETDKASTMKKIRAVLGSHEKATGGRLRGNRKIRGFESYTLDGLNTSHNLRDIVSSLKSRESGTENRNFSVSLLLYGMPGTGKSEFVYYLGNLLGKEILLKRGSDIHSRYVGETEKNIAEAFEEAGESGDILFFDEADTFLFPRSQAYRSWEISFTNEILTQLESSRGVVVFATNNMDGLDHAALRRFRFKIYFKPLTPEGKLHFYNKLLSGLTQDRHLASPECRTLMRIKNLTPGDFAVVRDQFSFLISSEISHGKLIEALANEVRYKNYVGKGIGF
ncbi:MAG: ATP-binding protein [Nitrospirae bacterium]|nr:ATP-binding protein [Nitrospirota bacterium]